MQQVIIFEGNGPVVQNIWERWTPGYIIYFLNIIVANGSLCKRTQHSQLATCTEYSDLPCTGDFTISVPVRGQIKRDLLGVIKNNTEFYKNNNQWFWCQTISIHQSIY